MKKQFLINLIAASTVLIGITGFEAKYAYAFSYYSGQGYSYGTNGTWRNYGGLWYFYDTNGYMKTGWVLNNGKWYFLDNSGVMQTGIIQVNGKVYLLNENGEMQVGNAIVDGVMYNFSSSGEISGSNYPNITKGFSIFGETMTSYSPNQVITNEDSTPDNPSENSKDDDKSVHYTIEFRNENGDTIKSKNVYKGEKVTLYEPSKSGYDFDCWSTKEDGDGKTYDALDEITIKGDMVLYANWDEDDNENSNNLKVFSKSITITSDDNKGAITEKSGTLQLYASVYPENTTNKNVTWSIIDGSENATISKNGLVKAIKDGTVTICAKSKDGTNVEEKINITISGQNSEENGNNNNSNNNNGNSQNQNNSGQVMKPVSSIEIISQPRLDYEYSEQLDLSELKVKVHYTDGTVTEEIPYSQFSNYNIIIKNYNKGQSLEKSYVKRNPNIIIVCNNKTVNTNDLNMKVVESPKLLSTQKSFDKNDKQDVVFEYSDGINVDMVKKITITSDGHELTAEECSVDYETKKITIKKEYLEKYDVGYVNLDIVLKNESDKALIDRLCRISIIDSKEKAAPNNFIKLEAGTSDKKTKITILNTTSEGSESEEANYNATDLQYAINRVDLANNSLLVTWKDYIKPIEVSVNPNEYINIRKKPAISSQKVLVASKQITEENIASISSMNTIKSFKLKDSENNIYEGIINGLNITVVVDYNNDTTKNVDITKLTPIIEYDGTPEESSKVQLRIGNRDIAEEGRDNSIITYKTSSSYGSSISIPVTCKVIAENGSSKTYNISVYDVKPQEVQIRPKKTIYKYEDKTVTKTDANGITTSEVEKERVSVDIDYSSLYSEAGIDINKKSGLAEIKIWENLVQSQHDAMNKIVDADKESGYSSQIANVGLVFVGAPASAQSVRISTSLEGLDLSEDIVELNGTNSEFVLDKKYLKNVPIAVMHSKEGGGTIWEYIYKDDSSLENESKSEKYYYEWLDQNNKILGYSKIEIRTKAQHNVRELN